MMKCIKCGKNIPDGSVFCLYCGKKQITQKKQKVRSRKGQGSVTYRKDKQKYWARVISSDGKRIHLGYFKTESEAWSAVDKALKETITDNYNWTVQKCYDIWSESHYPNISDSAIGNYKNAWRYFTPIKSMKMRDVKTSHLQKCVDLGAEKFSRAVCEKIKSLASQLCKFAMQEDIINKNYAEFLKLPKSTAEETTPFNDIEVSTLFRNDSDDTCKVILIMIYSGFRPNELLKIKLTDIDIDRGYFRGGSKTKAGINRIVPIHSKIESYVKYFYNKSSERGWAYLITNEQGHKIDLSNWRKRKFYRTLEQIGILENESDRHVTPYSARHTFATMCDRANIDDNIIIKMMGHTQISTTEKFYIHKTDEEMKKAIESI